MANGKAFDNAVDLTGQNPELLTGVHITLVGEKPVCKPEKIKKLVCKNGNLPENHKKFLLLYVLRRIKRSDIYNEINAQIEKVLNAGLKINHIDSHQHLHMLPEIFDITLELAQKHGIRNIRISKQGIREIRTLKGLGLTVCANICEKKALAAGIRLPDYFLGLDRSGVLEKKDLLDFSNGIKPGITEIMCHPGYIDNEYMKRYSPWKYNPELELKALTDADVKI